MTGIRSIFRRAFTLIELIMVMVIIAILAAIVAPSLRDFGVSRQTNNTATQIVALAHYAHGQAIADGCAYRLNFDAANRAFWLTEQSGAQFVAPANNFGKRYQAPDGVKMTVNVTTQFNTQLNVPSNVQQVQALGNPLSDQPGLQPNQLMENQRVAGQVYVEFLPTGRSDPAQIQLVDRLGHSIEVACGSATEQFRILKPGESP